MTMLFRQLSSNLGTKITKKPNQMHCSTIISLQHHSVKTNQFPLQVPQYQTSIVQRGGSDTQWTSGRRSDAGTPGRENWPTNSCNKQFQKMTKTIPVI